MQLAHWHERKSSKRTKLFDLISYDFIVAAWLFNSLLKNTSEQFAFYNIHVQSSSHSDLQQQVFMQQ